MEKNKPIEPQPAHGGQFLEHLEHYEHTELQDQPGGTDQQIHIYADTNDTEYEWLQLPKKRSYDLFRVPRVAPSERDTAQIPLTATRHADQARVTLWAKMDTGADANVINRSTLEKLLGDALEAHCERIPSDAEAEFGLMDNQKFRATDYCYISFWAGAGEGQLFEGVKFVVLEDDQQWADRDGVPNVLLGYPFLRENSMVMIDFAYLHEADERLEVIADKAEKEKENHACILGASIVKLPKTPGVKRPAK